LGVRRRLSGIRAGGRHVCLSHARPRLNLIVRPRPGRRPSLRLGLTASPSLSPGLSRNLKPCSNLKPSLGFKLGLSLHGIRRLRGRIRLMGLWRVNRGVLQLNAGAIAAFEVPALSKYPRQAGGKLSYSSVEGIPFVCTRVTIGIFADGPPARATPH